MCDLDGSRGGEEVSRMTIPEKVIRDTCCPRTEWALIRQREEPGSWKTLSQRENGKG